jgi:hypothetical protein
MAGREASSASFSISSSSASSFLSRSSRLSASTSGVAVVGATKLGAAQLGAAQLGAAMPGAASAASTARVSGVRGRRSFIRRTAESRTGRSSSGAEGMAAARDTAGRADMVGRPIAERRGIPVNRANPYRALRRGLRYRPMGGTPRLPRPPRIVRPMHLTRDELLRRIADGEGARQEFKRGLPGSDKVARTLAAFANSKGGLLLIGVEDGGQVVGVPAPEEACAELQEIAATHVDPPARAGHGGDRRGADGCGRGRALFRGSPSLPPHPHLHPSPPPPFPPFWPGPTRGHGSSPVSSRRRRHAPTPRSWRTATATSVSGSARRPAPPRTLRCARCGAPRHPPKPAPISNARSCAGSRLAASPTAAAAGTQPRTRATAEPRRPPPHPMDSRRPAMWAAHGPGGPSCRSNAPGLIVGHGVGVRRGVRPAALTPLHRVGPKRPREPHPSRAGAGSAGGSERVLFAVRRRRTRPPGAPAPPRRVRVPGVRHREPPHRHTRDRVAVRLLDQLAQDLAPLAAPRRRGRPVR